MPVGNPESSQAGREDESHLGSRLDWRFLIPDLARATVLCIAPDSTAIPQALSRWCDRVVSVAESEAVHVGDRPADLATVHAELDRIPPSERRFDLVVLGGLLEKIAGGSTNRPSDLMTRMADLLRPGGHLVIEARNHSPLATLRRSSAEGQSVVRMVCGLLGRRWRLNGAADGSPGAGLALVTYLRWLNRAGLTRQSIYWVEPACESPRHWIRLERRGPALYYLSGPRYQERTRARLLRACLRALAAAGGAKRIASNFLIIAGRGSHDRSA